MTTRARRDTDPPSYPMVPHAHTCRTCPARHKWTCPERRCVWNVLLPCKGPRAAAG